MSRVVSVLRLIYLTQSPPVGRVGRRGGAPAAPVGRNRSSAKTTGGGKEGRLFCNICSGYPWKGVLSRLMPWQLRRRPFFLPGVDMRWLRVGLIVGGAGLALGLLLRHRPAA